VLGLLLVALAGVAGAWLVLASQSITTSIDLKAWGFTVGLTPLTLIIVGAAVLLVLWLGLALIRGSLRRRRRPAREAKAAQRQAEVEENIRADERARSEEAHQSALAERDRVRDEEFQSRLTQRDQERDEEFGRRQAEEEERIRADERARVEEEHRSRAAGAGSPAAVVAAGGGVDEAAMERRATEADAPTGATTQRLATDASDADSPLSSDVNSDVGSDADSDTPPADASGRHRTVADEIMGRGPSE
jgi:hypothetical protein